MRYKSTPAQFAARLVPREGGCRNWPGPFQTRGLPYGKTKYRGRTIGAHVLAWMFANGQTEPPTLNVCHTCDRPPCCEESHLWLGTDAENSADRDAKERTGQLKATRVVRAAIRAAYADGLTQRAVATRYAVGHTVVGRVVVGIDGPQLVRRREILRRVAAGEHQSDVARAFGMSKQSVSRICKNGRG